MTPRAIRSSSPLVRQTPMFVGVDGVNLNVTGTSEFTPFFGTSAAAPSVARLPP